MSATIKSEPYKLELVTGNVPRSHWWKNSDTVESADVWWLTGGGLNRAATDVEIELHKRAKPAITQEDYNAACNKRLEVQQALASARKRLREIAEMVGYHGNDPEAILAEVECCIRQLKEKAAKAASVKRAKVK
jgi:hypothetical protein